MIEAMITDDSYIFCSGCVDNFSLLSGNLVMSDTGQIIGENIRSIDAKDLPPGTICDCCADNGFMTGWTGEEEWLSNDALPLAFYDRGGNKTAIDVTWSLFSASLTTASGLVVDPDSGTTGYVSFDES